MSGAAGRRTNKDWLDADRKFIVQTAGPRPFPVLAEGKGCRVMDVEGKSYLDLTSGQVCAALGHGHPALIDAIRKQAEKLVHTSSFFTNTAMIELAEKLAPIAPGNLKKAVFLSTGSESVELALRMARLYTGRNEVIAPSASYFGLTGGVAKLTALPSFRRGVNPASDGGFHYPSPYCYRCPYGLTYPECDLFCADFSEELIKTEAVSGLSAWVSEPILSGGGMIVPPDDYFKRVGELAKKHGALLIFDEAQTGLGRTGKMFGCEHYGVVPDIMALSKTLGFGVPIAAVLTTPEIASDLEKKGLLWGTSHLGDPLPCAVASAGLDVVVNERLDQKAARTGEYFMKRLNELKDRYEIVGDVRGKGLMIGLELVKDRRSREPAEEEAGRIMDACLERGMIISLLRARGHNSVFRIVPPLTISHEEVDESVDILEESIKEVRPAKP